jgi:hypothetical protein
VLLLESVEEGFDFSKAFVFFLGFFFRYFFVVNYAVVAV